MLRNELRCLHTRQDETDKICDSCVRRNSIIMKEVSVQTNNIEDVGDKRYDLGGSGIVRVCFFGFLISLQLDFY